MYKIAFTSSGKNRSGHKQQGEITPALKSPYWNSLTCEFTYLRIPSA
ncbi:MAG: hypothetical protein ACRC10_03120 [Thermoguttaceae bacterium]